jgi:hypothetical protein
MVPALGLRQLDVDPRLDPPARQPRLKSPP